MEERVSQDREPQEAERPMKLLKRWCELESEYSADNNRDGHHATDFSHRCRSTWNEVVAITGDVPETTLLAPEQGNEQPMRSLRELRALYSGCDTPPLCARGKVFDEHEDRV